MVVAGRRHPEEVGGLGILHVVGATIAGGAERVAVSLACQQATDGDRVAVFALSGRCDAVGAAMRKDLITSRVTLDSGPPGRVGYASIRALGSCLLALRPDVVHLHTPNTELAYALQSRRGRATARTIHNVLVNRSLPYRWAYRRNSVLRSVACSAAVAEANADWAGDAEVIPNGVRFTWDVRSPPIAATAKATLGLSVDKAHFLMVGAMRGGSLADAPKGHDVAIAAWRSAAMRDRGAVLHLVGDGELRQKLEQLASGDESIRFHGISDRVPTWLQAADVFLMPSRFEGLPIAGIEALGTGLPVIFSRIRPLRELEPTVVEWVEPSDSQSLADAMVAMFNTRMASCEMEAHEVRRRFGMSEMGRLYREYYLGILRRGRGPSP